MITATANTARFLLSKLSSFLPYQVDIRRYYQPNITRISRPSQNQSVIKSIGLSVLAINFGIWRKSLGSFFSPFEKPPWKTHPGKLKLVGKGDMCVQVMGETGGDSSLEEDDDAGDKFSLIQIL